MLAQCQHRVVLAPPCLCTQLAISGAAQHSNGVRLTSLMLLVCLLLLDSQAHCKCWNFHGKRRHLMARLD